MHRFFKKVNAGHAAIILVLLLTLLLAGSALACGDDEDDKTTTTSTAKEDEGGSGPSGGADYDGGATTEDETDGTEADGDGPTVVNTTDTYGPCVDGMQEVTHHTEYSDGTEASSIAMVPCSDDIEPVEP